MGYSNGSGGEEGEAGKEPFIQTTHSFLRFNGIKYRFDTAISWDREQEFLFLQSERHINGDRNSCSVLVPPCRTHRTDRINSEL
jgi:hypothetical protein